MKEIGIEDVIRQVKLELLAPNPAAQSRDPYPLLAIDKIELEIVTRITRSTDGSIKLSVLDVAEINTGHASSREQAHVVRVSLSPLLSREELIAAALKDEAVQRIVQNDSQRAFLRHDDRLSGESE